MSLHQASSLRTVVERLVGLEEVLGCFQLTGDVDFLPKVATRDMNSYTIFIDNKVSDIPGNQNIKTSFVLHTVKSSTRLVLPE